LKGVIEAVSGKRCEFGVIPFYNSNHHCVNEAQGHILKYRNKVYANGVYALKVVHNLCGYGSVPSVTEVRSKSVVFKQASRWLDAKLPNATRVDAESTSAAIKSLKTNTPAHAAAIGTDSASKGYEVPVIRRGIQNKPNVTLFFVIQKTQPKILKSERVLMAVAKTKETDYTLIDGIVQKAECFISSNWRVKCEGTGKNLGYFFEIDGHFGKLNLYNAVKNIKELVKDSFVVGAYEKQSITDLLPQM
jgi:prephenate dehydratase